MNTRPFTRSPGGDFMIESASIVLSPNGSITWKMHRDGKDYGATFEEVGVAGLDAAVYNMFQTDKALKEQEVS